MAPHRNWDPSCKVYIGNLRDNANETEIEDAFSKYGPLKNIWIARNPPGFAFVEYEDARDAEDAVKELHGSRCCGARIVVEMSTGKSRNRDSNRRRRSPPSYKRRSSPPHRFRSRSPVYKYSRS